MVKVGDRIRLSSMKGSDREGVVIAVAGPLVRVRWPSEQETTLVPAPGTLTVLAAGEAGPRTAAKKKGATKNTSAKTKSAASTSATPKKQMSRNSKAAKRSTP